MKLPGKAALYYSVCQLTGCRAKLLHAHYRAGPGWCRVSQKLGVPKTCMTGQTSRSSVLRRDHGTDSHTLQHKQQKAPHRTRCLKSLTPQGQE